MNTAEMKPVRVGYWKTHLVAGALMFLSASVNAVERVNEGGSQVLLFPFYTVENNWDSYLNLFSDNNIQLALRIRILDGMDGEVVNTFNVYLDELESFRASISRSSDGETAMLVAEGNCIIDENLESGGVGSTYSLGASTGLVEVYEIARSPISASFSCEDAVSRWRPGGAWHESPDLGLIGLGATGGTSGEMYLVNVSEGLSATYAPTGLRNFLQQMPHTPASSELPSLADADPIVSIDGEEITLPESTTGIDAVSISLRQHANSIVNDVIVANEIGARSDWVVVYPLQAYKNEKPYEVVTDEETLYCDNFGRLAQPEELVVRAQIGQLHPVHAWGGGAEYDGGTVRPPLEVDVTAAMCRTINIISFGDKASILVPEDSSYITKLPEGLSPAFEDVGSFVLRWTPDAASTLLGFRLTVFQNDTLEGGTILANYAAIRPHRKYFSDF